MSKNTLIERRKQTLQNQGEKTFMVRNFPLYIFLMFLIYPLAALFSGMTEGFYVFSNFQTTLNSNTQALILTAIIVVLIEGGSIILGKSMFEDIRHGAIGGSGSEVFVFVLKTIGFLICYTFSVILSIGGAPQTTERVKEQRSPIVLVSIDSIHQKYDALLAIEDEDIGKANSMTWKGKIVEDGRDIIKAAKERKSEIDQDRRNDIEKAEAENKRRQDKYNAATLATGKWTMKFTGIGQLLMLICLFFSYGYQSAEAEEMGINPSVSGSNVTRSTGAFFQGVNSASSTLNTIGPTPDPPRRRIGFKQNGLDGYTDTKNNDTDCAPCATNNTAKNTQSVPIEKTMYVAQDIGKYKKYIRTIYPRTLEPIPVEEPDHTKKIQTINSRRQKLNEAINELKKFGIETSLNKHTGKAHFS